MHSSFTTFVVITVAASTVSALAWRPVRALLPRLAGSAAAALLITGLAVVTIDHQWHARLAARYHHHLTATLTAVWLEVAVVLAIILLTVLTACNGFPGRSYPAVRRARPQRRTAPGRW